MTRGTTPSYVISFECNIDNVLQKTKTVKIEASTGDTIETVS